MSLKPNQVRLQPKRFPVERVKVDFRKLLSSMGQALTRGTFAFFAPDSGTAASSAVNAGAAIFGAVEAFEADAALEVRAWYLVRSALAAALGQLLGELHERKGPFGGDLDHLDNRFDLLLEGDSAVIDRNFLDNPRTLKFLPEIRRVLEGWLATKVELGTGEARSLALRLDAYLAPALRDESRAHRDYYRPIYDHLEDRFADAAQMEWDWERNRLELIRQMDLPVFEETFSLRQVYVPLRAYTLEEIETDEPRQDGRQRHCKIKMLQDEIDAWLKDGPKRGDDIRLVTGGPGSGKSTFAKWLAAELSEKNRMRVLFIPLQRFRVEKRLDDAIARYLTTTGRFQNSPIAREGFASPGDPLLLTFDGLDELTKPGDLTDEQTKLFIEELRQHLGLWNDGGVKVLALITGRTVYAQAKRPLLRIADHQEVVVLPYLVAEGRVRELRAHHIVSGQGLLEDDQREQWWRNYGLAKAMEEESLPKVFKTNHDLRELTADPLLNYLVVLSGFHNDLAGGPGINGNRIYARLLKDVLDRRHAKKTKTDQVALAAVDETKNRDNFERLLETIALAAWYGDGRTTTRGEIEKVLPHDLDPTWQELVTGGPGFTRLIAAFYIRQTEVSAVSDAIEFTHKSFGEYLTARRLGREIGRICNGRRNNADFYPEQHALADWARLTGAQAMTIELLRFLRDEVALRSKPDVKAWQETLTSLFNSELRSGFSLAALPSDGFREAERRARNSEESLLAALDACARVSEERLAVAWPHVISAGDMLHRLRKQRGDLDQLSVVLACLARLPLSRQILFSQDLSHADLIGADLNVADLRATLLERADLLSAKLSAASLRVAYLGGARLRNADLSGADLYAANLIGADLFAANLRGADLRETMHLSAEQILDARDITDAKLPDHLKHLEKKGRPRRGRRAARATP